MRRRRVAVIGLLLGLLLLCLPLAAGAEERAPISISPSLVEVGLNFGGADVLVEGELPAGTDLIVRVATDSEVVKLSKKGKFLGIFWMTTERAVVENMPSFHAVYSSKPLESLLSKEERSRLGVDAECTEILKQAEVTSDVDHQELSPEQAHAYAVGLRDMYIKSGRYVPCVSCHRTPSGVSRVSYQNGPGHGMVHIDQNRWSLNLRLPQDTPLGEYDVTAFYVQGGKVVDTQTATFGAAKTGLVRDLGTMATQNAVVYGAMSLGVVVVVGLAIGVVFPKGGRH
jgi:hypothetical protein